MDDKISAFEIDLIEFAAADGTRRKGVQAKVAFVAVGPMGALGAPKFTFDVSCERETEVFELAREKLRHFTAQLAAAADTGGRTAT